jgi:hypothetical protein
MNDPIRKELYESMCIFDWINVCFSTAHQLNISQKALGTLPEDGNIMPKHVGDTIHN